MQRFLCNARTDQQHDHEPQQEPEAKTEATSKATAKQAPGTQAEGDRDQAQQHHQPKFTATKAKPQATAAKARPPIGQGPAPGICQTAARSEASSSSNQPPMPSTDGNHFTTILQQEPPFTALQQGLPVLRDLLSHVNHQTRAQATYGHQPTQPHPMPPPPPVPLCPEELLLALQISQTLTTHIQTLTAKILATHQQAPTSNIQAHHNDVITIDSQESWDQVQLQPPADAAPMPAQAQAPQMPGTAEGPASQAATQTWPPEPTTTRATAHNVDSQTGPAPTHRDKTQQPQQEHGEAAETTTEAQADHHPPQNNGQPTDTAHPDADTCTHGEPQQQPQQPWWVLGHRPTKHHQARSRSPPHHSIATAAGQQAQQPPQMTQHDVDEDHVDMPTECADRTGTECSDKTD